MQKSNELNAEPATDPRVGAAESRSLLERLSVGGIEEREAAARIATLEARLDAIDSALDDADAPDATDAHSLDSDPIIERIKLWNHAFDAIADNYEAWLAESQRQHEQFGRDIAGKLGIDYAPPVAKGDCAYLAAIESLKEESAKLRAALVKVEAYIAGEDGPLFELWEDGDIGNYDDTPTEWEQTLFDIRDWKHGSVPTASLGYGTEWPAVTLYREILAALEAPEGAREVKE